MTSHLHLTIYWIDHYWRVVNLTLPTLLVPPRHWVRNPYWPSSRSSASLRTSGASWSTSMDTNHWQGHDHSQMIGEKGPLHLQPVSHAYPMKESLQPKHYQVHLVGTTYVYNFPELFSKAIQNVWIKARSQESSLSLPKKFPDGCLSMQSGCSFFKTIPWQLA